MTQCTTSSFYRAEEYYQALQKMSDEELNATYQVNQPG